MWNKSVCLLTGLETGRDGEGYVSETRKTWLTGIPANFLDVTREDEILAQQYGYTASQRIEIAACNYNGEKTLLEEASGERYEVRRAFRKNKGNFVELICERREPDG